MRTEYSAAVGIGYDVWESDELSESGLVEDDYDDNLGEYIDDNIGDPFECLTYGNAYRGDNEFALVIKEPFKTGLDLTEAKALLDAEVKRLKLEAGEFGLAGGLSVY